MLMLPTSLNQVASGDYQPSNEESQDDETELLDLGQPPKPLLNRKEKNSSPQRTKPFLSCNYERILHGSKFNNLFTIMQDL